MAEARVLVANTGPDTYLPEGLRAVVVEGRPALAWVNIQTAPDAKTGTIHLRFWDDGECRSFPLPGRPGFLVSTDRPDVLFVGCEKTLGVFDLRRGHWDPWAKIPDPSPRTIINDGEGAPDGRAVVFGTKDLQFKEPIADLYLFTLDDRKVRTLAPGQTCSNGKVFARDGSHFYDIDTPTRKVVRYQMDRKAYSVSDPELAIDLSKAPGFPDGMRDAGAGTAVIAFYNPDVIPAGRAVRFDLTTGKELEEWTTPGSPRVTCPLLLERDGRVDLVLTTAVEGMPEDQRARCPNAGNLFIAETGLKAPSADVLRL
jgi:sugar lactone lactonase YvrE